MYKKYDLQLKILEEYSPYEPITSSDILTDFIRKAIGPDNFPEERMYVICLSSKGEPISFMEAFKGTIHDSNVSIAKIFQFALLSNAAAIAVTHNHPSGVSAPSDPDKEFTDKLELASQIMDIPLIDHIITTPTDYFSFRANGI